MSHGKERKDKNCLNCGAEVLGHYCQNCGQANIEPRETFAGLIRHFFEDITHFDGKFFTTLKTLLLKPGFLSKAYLRGQRNRYLHPVRMYIFTSFVFFLYFFTLGPGKPEKNELSGIQRKFFLINKVSSDRTVKPGDEKLKIINLLTDTSKIIYSENLDSLSIDDLNSQRILSLDSTNKKDLSNAVKGPLRNLSKILATSDEDSFFEEVVHQMPKVMFVFLPIYALILLIFYSRYNILFTQHGIFTIHLFIFYFISTFIIFLLEDMSDLTGWYLFKSLQVSTLIFMAGYTYKAFRNFYGQGRLKSLVKASAISIIAFFTIIFLVMALLIYKVYTY